MAADGVAIMDVEMQEALVHIQQASRSPTRSHRCNMAFRGLSVANKGILLATQ